MLFRLPSKPDLRRYYSKDFSTVFQDFEPQYWYVKWWLKIWWVQDHFLPKFAFKKPRKMSKNHVLLSKLNKKKIWIDRTKKTLYISIYFSIVEPTWILFWSNIFILTVVCCLLCDFDSVSLSVETDSYFTFSCLSRQHQHWQLQLGNRNQSLKANYKLK